MKRDPRCIQVVLRCSVQMIHTAKTLEFLVMLIEHRTRFGTSLRGALLENMVLRRGNAHRAGIKW
jgi:hypothetical protein